MNNYQCFYLCNAAGGGFVLPAEIIRCEGFNNQTLIHLHGKPPILISKTMKWCESVLPPHHFARIHQRHIINIDFISAVYLSDNAYVKMINCKLLPVARARKKHFYFLLHERFVIF